MDSIKELGYKFAEIIYVLEMRKTYYRLICSPEDCWEEGEGKKNTQWLLVYTARIVQGCYAKTLIVVMVSVCFHWKTVCGELWAT